MHTGLDFRAATGDPVRATANGKVLSSGWMGGYGRMVEIDHGNGLSTRYGHLSEIHVKVGDVVRIGQVIGAVGSTGRSTGPHLHYDTRIDGDAGRSAEIPARGRQAQLRASIARSELACSLINRAKTTPMLPSSTSPKRNRRARVGEFFCPMSARREARRPCGRD